ncbi:MAG TPA: hypothetical protein VGM86_31250 [Thermoanaerobaculia bacterium]|jgi:hypothetical protein
MDEAPKPLDGPTVVAELRQALAAAARCIELAKREVARIDASLRAQSAGGAQVEQVFLDTTRKRREQLSRIDLRFELPPSPPEEQAPRPLPPGIENPRDGDLVEALSV